MWLRDPAFRGDRRPPGGNQLYVTGWTRLAVTGEETGATTDDDHGVDPARPDLHLLAGQGRQDAIEALLRQFRPAIVRYCRARLARTGSLDEDDVAQEVCLALLSALPSYRDMGRPFGAFVFAIAARKVADAARGAARSPLPVPVLPDLPDRCPGPEETVVAGVDARQARVLLASLPAGAAAAAPAPGGGGAVRRGHRLRARHVAGCGPRRPAPGPAPAPRARRPDARRHRGGVLGPRGQRPWAQPPALRYQANAKCGATALWPHLLSGTPMADRGTP